MDHLFYCYSEILHMFVADNEDGFLVCIEIMMADDVSKRLCFFPIHLGVIRQQIFIRDLVEILASLSYGNQLHANSIEFFQA